MTILFIVIVKLLLRLEKIENSLKIIKAIMIQLWTIRLSESI
jgi:hypothetical protein